MTRLKQLLFPARVLGVVTLVVLAGTIIEDRPDWKTAAFVVITLAGLAVKAAAELMSK